MLLSAVSVLVVAQSSSEIREGLMNNPVYSEARMRIFNSLNSCLQDVLELTPTVDLITRFCILSILVVNSPPTPPHPKIIYQYFSV